MKPIIVIPTYNESENIKELVPTIRDAVTETPVDVLVVDSGSPDGTAEVVQVMQKSDPRLHLVTQPRKMGLGKAYLDGMAWAFKKDFDCLITMDADFSHHPRYLNGMLKEIKDVDLVIGSRYIRGGRLKSWPFYRRFLSRFANWYARTLIGMPLSDLTSGFHCFRMPLLKDILSHGVETEGYAFLVELKLQAVRRKVSYREIPITFQDRTKGNSKISRSVIFESMLFVLKSAIKRKG